MRADLLHAQASVDWANDQFPSFRQRVDSWLNDNIEIAIRDPDPTVPNNVIVAAAKQPLPFSFIVETGAYINAIRSSLDILATALAYRHGMPKPEDVYFPVAPSEPAFKSGGYKGAEFVKGLPAAERALIESLEPYKGGHTLLWPLHRLDIVRKHKRLLETAIWPGEFSIMGWGLSTAFTPLADFVSVNDETVLGLIAKGTQAQVNFSPQIAINEPELMRRMPVIVALHEFAKFASAVIASFDA